MALNPRAPRILKPTLEKLFQQYPIVTVTGPRQSGKTTLCRTTFPHLAYVNLERPDVRERVENDPRGFLRRHPDGAILDEIQRVPELVSYLQVLVDEAGRTGQFVLTGSQHFKISQALGQSLAGRTALVRLLPFSIGEALALRPDLGTDEMLFRGFYPRLYERSLDPTQALGDYFETYVERDVRQIGEIRNLTAFQRFVRLCAGRVGQLLNLSSLGADAGVSHTTAGEWLSVLEASFVVFRLQPYHANLSKRLVKSPKLYFYDVGLATFLLGVENEQQLYSHPLRGSLFENLVVAEALKHRLHHGRRGNLFFLRDGRGFEVDLIYEMADKILAAEVKSSATLSDSFFRGLTKLRDLLGETVVGDLLVYDGEETYRRRRTLVTYPRDLSASLDAMEREALGLGPRAGPSG